MKERIHCLDGLRGIAALWVLIGHAMDLTGFAVPILANADLGVDLFILLSGFLMVYQYQLRAEHEDWRKPRTWLAFWLRRFFRLSPLYYVVLIVGLTAGSSIYHDRVVIDQFLGNPLQLATRYQDPSALNFLMHFSYAFGLLPDYAFRTPLPDWSLGLEMQFYLAFPFLILVVRRIGWLKFAAATAVCVWIATYLLTTHGVHFPMPSFLPLRLHMFAAGMLIAGALTATPRGRLLHLVMALALAMIPIGGIADALHTGVRVALVLSFFALIHFHTSGVVGLTARVLSSKPFFWLGELSYSVYLVHLLVLTPVAAALIQRFGARVSQATMFAAAFVITAILSYSVARILYAAIEKPGQALGRRFIKATISRQSSLQTASEEIAAP